MVRDGDWAVDVNPPGPVHEYVAPETAGVVRFKVEPVQTGLLLEGDGVDGVAFTVTVDTAVLEHPFVVPVTVYDVVEAGLTEI